MSQHATSATAPPVDARHTDGRDDDTVTDLAALRTEIDYLDAEILRLVQRRTAVSQAIGAARRAAGGPRVVHGREMAVLDRYRELGTEGHELAMLLLRLGRGRLGHLST
ncbi:MAG TPA: chorismate mutase [Pseudonocardiaceae bacterium]|nr:chorismate mutase [Pseudonocardiaceae bacterium]